MNTLDSVIGSLSGCQLTVGALLRRLHVQGRLELLVREALAALLVQQQARQAGLSATDEELQATADSFRRRVGLTSANSTHAWLARQQLSVEEFEAGIEHDVLAAKFREHLTAPRVEEYFQAHQADFARLTVLELIVPREDLASELASQVRDEGQDLLIVAREQGLQLIRHELYRRHFAAPVAAALASATPGQLCGPVGTAQGFLLLLLEKITPAVLEGGLRQCIQQELFEEWMAARMKDATIELALGEAT